MKYVEERDIGPLSYSIQKVGKHYRLWRNGCRIGRPRDDKPRDEIWEFSTPSIKTARAEMEKDAAEELLERITQLETETKRLYKALRSLPTERN